MHRKPFIYKGLYHGKTGGPGLIYRCMYSYDFEGTKYEGYEYSKQFNSSWLHELDQTVKIMVNEENPKEFILIPVITHYFTFAFVPIIFLVLTILVLIATVTGNDPLIEAIKTLRI